MEKSPSSQESNGATGTDENRGKDTKSTPRLITACMGGNVTIAKAILKRAGDHDVNVRDNKGNTPLIAACEHGHLEIVELILTKGADVSSGNDDGSSPLMFASKNGHNDIVKKLIDKGAKVNRQARDGSSPLMIASQNGHNHVVKTLIEKQAKVNMQKNDGWSSLMLASLNGHSEVVETLIEKGAGVDIQNNDAWSPLMVASLYGHNQVVKILTEKGAKVDMQNKDGWSPLMLASQNGHNEVIETLIEKGAKVNLQHNDGWSPLMIASGHGHNTVVKTLIDKGARVNRQASDGMSSLMLASEYGHNDVVITPIDKQAKVNMQHNDGVSPLMFAGQNGHNDVIKTLIENGANVNLQSKDGTTALIIVCIHGQTTTAKILLENHADMNLQEQYGATALDFAIRKGYEEIVEMLLLAEKTSNRGNPYQVDQTTPDLNVMSLSSSQTNTPETSTVNLAKETTDRSKLSLTDDQETSEIENSKHRELAANVGVSRDSDTASASADQIAAAVEGDSKQLDQPWRTGKQMADKILQNKQKRSPHPTERVKLYDTTKVQAYIKRQKEERRKEVLEQKQSLTKASSERQKKLQELYDRQRKMVEVKEKHTSKLSIADNEETKLDKDVSVSGDTASASADQIAATVGINSKQLDQPCSEDLLWKISRLLPDWMEYAVPLKLTPHEINRIKHDHVLNFTVQSYMLLRTWYNKSIYTDWCHYRVLVETSCELGHADVAGSMCQMIKTSTEPPQSVDDSSVEHISKDLILFKKETIGGGAFGSVFRGELNGQRCAIKVLYPLANELKTDLPTASNTKQDSLERFQRECEYMESFQHTNIVRHLATRTHPKSGHLVLALELMDCNLRQFLSSPSGKDLPFLNQKSLCHDIASALVYIHSRHIVHRDLCSDNILLDCKGEPPVAKVCDFGMSRIISTDETSLSLAAFGHGGYLPPEATHLESTYYDSSFDIFSFGAIIVQIVRRLPTIKSDKERRKQFDKIDSTHPLKSTIEQCLQEDGKDRPTAIELERDLC